MSWNYRVCRYKANGETLFAVREIYYDEKGAIKATAPASVDCWETAEDAKGTLALMLAACEQPVLELEDDA